MPSDESFGGLGRFTDLLALKRGMVCCRKNDGILVVSMHAGLGFSTRKEVLIMLVDLKVLSIWLRADADSDLRWLLSLTGPLLGSAQAWALKLFILPIKSMCLLVSCLVRLTIIADLERERRLFLLVALSVRDA
jgi:hypothetical protein